MKRISKALILLALISLTACSPGAQYTLPPGITIVPGTDIPQQIASIVANALTQTAFPATQTPVATLSPIPGVPTLPLASLAPQKFYQSSSLGIQFTFPDNWYLQELPSSQPPIVMVASFDPNNPPHKLEWTDQTTSIQFRILPFATFPDSFEAWVESAKQAALANQQSIFAEERFQIAGQTAAHLSLVSGSGGILHQVFSILNGHYFEIDIEGNFSLAKSVLDTVQIASSPPVTAPPPVTFPPPLATAPPPIVEYNNSTLGYRLNLPGDWIINETNSSSKEVIFSPPNAEPFVSYLSVSLESRTLDQVINYYAQNMSILNVVREDTVLNGYPAVKYIFTRGRNEYFIPYGNQIFLIATDRPNDGVVQSILMSVRFTAPPQHAIYNVTMADNGRTFYMKIGDELRIYLDEAYIWSMASISDPNVLAGAQAGYFAFANGTATLSMTGNPECLNATPPCGMPSILFTITVVVQ